MKNTTCLIGLSLGLALFVFVSTAFLIERPATAKLTRMQPLVASPGVNQPLEKVLNADGTLNIGT